MPGKYETVTNRRTPEQELAFQLARSQALRGGSHTVEGAGSSGASGQPAQQPKQMQPNPKYAGIAGIFTAISDALTGEYQKEVPK